MHLDVTHFLIEPHFRDNREKYLILNSLIQDLKWTIDLQNAVQSSKVCHKTLPLHAANSVKFVLNKIQFLKFNCILV